MPMPFGAWAVKKNQNGMDDISGWILVYIKYCFCGLLVNNVETSPDVKAVLQF